MMMSDDGFHFCFHIAPPRPAAIQSNKSNKQISHQTQCPPIIHSHITLLCDKAAIGKQNKKLVNSVFHPYVRLEFK